MRKINIMLVLSLTELASCSNVATSGGISSGGDKPPQPDAGTASQQASTSAPSPTQNGQSTILPGNSAQPAASTDSSTAASSAPIPSAAVAEAELGSLIASTQSSSFASSLGSGLGGTLIAVGGAQAPVNATGTSPTELTVNLLCQSAAGGGLCQINNGLVTVGSSATTPTQYTTQLPSIYNVLLTVAQNGTQTAMTPATGTSWCEMQVVGSSSLYVVGSISNSATAAAWMTNLADFLTVNCAPASGSN